MAAPAGVSVATVEIKASEGAKSFVSFHTVSFLLPIAQSFKQTAEGCRVSSIALV